MDDPGKLLDNVIAYLKHQQEMYGDFESVEAASQKTRSKSSKETEHNSISSSSSESATEPPKYASADPDAAEAGQPAESKNTTAETSKSQSHLFSTNPDASGNIYDQVEACQSLKELYELCKKTDVLKTDLEGTNLVFGVGNPDADLVLIGEAPGHEEDKQGEPFVGRAGQLLNDILKAIDLEREDIYIANILKHRPPNNRNPLPEEVKRSLPFLLKQLDLIQPKLILCLGKVAANTLLGKKESLKNMRSTFYSFKDRYELLVTYHPAALLRNKRFKSPTWEDVQKLRKRYDELDCQPA